MSEWIALSKILLLECDSVKPKDLISGAFTARYEVHKNVGKRLTGYKDVVGIDVPLPGFKYKLEWRIVNETAPIAQSMGFHKEIRNSTIIDLVVKSATMDFFGTLEYIDYHNMEVMLTGK